MRQNLLANSPTSATTLQTTQRLVGFGRSC